jgi:hypothetical protein
MLARTLAALLVLAPLGADAAEIVQQVPVPPQVFFTALDTGGVQQQIPIELWSSFDRFDPGLGLLTRIDFAWDYHFRLTIDVTGMEGGAVPPAPPASSRSPVSTSSPAMAMVMAAAAMFRRWRSWSSR